MTLSEIAESLTYAGLCARGAFHPRDGDEAPPDAHTLVLVGNAGPAMWSAFRARVSEEMRGATIHPLDTWVREVIASVAARFQERTVR